VKENKEEVEKTSEEDRTRQNKTEQVDKTM